MVLCDTSLRLYLALRELVSLVLLIIFLPWPAKLCQTWLLLIFMILSYSPPSFPHLAHILLTSFKFLKPTVLSPSCLRDFAHAVHTGWDAPTQPFLK